MKKILVTTLALSLAVASTIDAKYIQKRGTRTMATANAATPASVAQPAADLMDAKKAKAPVKEPAEDVVAALTNPEMTPEQEELVAKRVKEADVERDIKLKKQEMADIGYGLFGFGTSQAQKEKYAECKRDLADLNTELKNVKSRIRELEVTTGKKWSNAVRLGIGALTAVGISLIGYGLDVKYNEGKGTQMLRGYGEAGYKRAGDFYGTAKEKVSNRYNKMMGNEVVAPNMQ
jgi:hypothetical protein